MKNYNHKVIVESVITKKLPRNNIFESSIEKTEIYKQKKQKFEGC